MYKNIPYRVNAGRSFIFCHPFSGQSFYRHFL
jgi:hypothetical protein